MNPRRPAAFQSGSRPSSGLGEAGNDSSCGRGAPFSSWCPRGACAPKWGSRRAALGTAGWGGVAWVSQPVQSLSCTSWLRGSVCEASLGRLRKRGLLQILLPILPQRSLKLGPVEAGGPSLQAALLDGDRDDSAGSIL